MSEFGVWLAARRKSENLTQAEFAQRIGLHPQTVSRIEQGKAPNRNNVRRIAEFLGENPDELVAFARGQSKSPAGDAVPYQLPPDVLRRLAAAGERHGLGPAEWLKRLILWVETHEEPTRSAIEHAIYKMGPAAVVVVNSKAPQSTGDPAPTAGPRQRLTG